MQVQLSCNKGRGRTALMTQRHPQRLWHARPLGLSEGSAPLHSHPVPLGSGPASCAAFRQFNALSLLAHLSHSII